MARGTTWHSFIFTVCILSLFMVAMADKRRELLTKCARKIDGFAGILDKLQNASNKDVVFEALLTVEVNISLDGLTSFEKQAMAVTLYEASVSHLDVDMTSKVLASMNELSLHLDLDHYIRMNRSDVDEVMKVSSNPEYRNVLPPAAQTILFLKLKSFIHDQLELFENAIAGLFQVALDNFNPSTLTKPQAQSFIDLLKRTGLDCKKRNWFMEDYFAIHNTENVVQIVERMKDLACFTPNKIITDTVKMKPTWNLGTIGSICEIKWLNVQAVALTGPIMEDAAFQSFGSVTTQNLRKLKYCMPGVEINRLYDLSIGSAMMPIFKGFSYPLRIRLALIDRIKYYFNANTITVTDLKPAVAVLQEKVITDYKDQMDQSVEDELINAIDNGIVTNRMSASVISNYVVGKRLRNGHFLADFTVAAVSQLKDSVVENITVDMYGFDNRTNNHTNGETVGVTISKIVIETLKSEKGEITSNARYWVRLFQKIKPYLCGVSVKDLSNTSDELFHQFVYEARSTSALCPPMDDAIQRRFRSYYKTSKKTQLTSVDVLLLRDSLPALPYSLLMSVDKKETTRFAAVGYLQSICLKGRFPKWRIAGVTKIALAMLTVETGEEIDSMKIKKLGCLVKYIKASTWDKTPASVIASSARRIGMYAIQKEERIVLRNKIQEHHYGSDTKKDLSAIPVEKLRLYLDLIGPTFTVDDIRVLPKDTLIRFKAVLARLDIERDACRAIILKVYAVTKYDGSTAKALDIWSMGKLLIGLSEEEISTFQPIVMLEVLDFIGLQTGFNDKQWEAWGKLALKVPGLKTSVNKLTFFKQFGHIFHAIKPSDIPNVIPKKEFVDLLRFIDVKLELVLFDRFIAKASMLFRSEQEKAMMYASLVKSLPALNSNKIRGLTPEIYKIISDSIGKQRGWNQEALAFLKNQAVQAYGPVQNWKGYRVSYSGVVIAGCKADELKSISPDLFPYVSPLAISHMSPEKFKSLTIKQILMMTPAQFAAVTSDQIEALRKDDEKFKAFEIASYYGVDPNVIPLIRQQRKCTDWGSGCQSGASSLLPFLPSLFLVVTTCLALTFLQQLHVI